MARFTNLAVCATVLLVGQSAAHFTLQNPPTIGFDDDLETTPPCGGFTVDPSKDNFTNFHVDGDFIAVTSIHPEATWLFRATLDQTASGNWTSLLPAVQQSSIGAFCETNVKVPSTWVGSKGVIGIVQDAPDGILYQCSTVNFVAGSITPSGVCKNVTGLSATYTADAKLSSLPATAAATSSSATATPTSSGKAQAGEAQTYSPYSKLTILAGVMMIGTVTFLVNHI